MTEQAANFKITETLAEGIKFKTYRAIDKQNQSIILKVVDNPVQNEETAFRLQNEFELLKTIDSPYVIKAINFIRNETRAILILEDISGKTLKNYLDQHTPVTDKTQVKNALEIAKYIAIGLSDIHRNRIVHYDISAKNIIYNPGTNKLQLIDFGLAGNDIIRQERSEGEYVSGTFAYISPEQTGRLDHRPDYRSDYYSFGVTLYELLSGRLPFIAQNPREWVHAHIALEPHKLSDIHPEIPGLVSAVVEKLLQKDPGARYQSGFGLLKDIEKCIQVIDQPYLAKNYTVGKYDTNQAFQLPQKIYGRAYEFDYLKNAVSQAKKSISHCVFIKGYSGIGKTRLIEYVKEHNEQKPYLFVTGKFEQYEQEKPFKIIGQIIQQISDYLLANKEKDIKYYKNLISDTIGNNLYLLHEIAPGLEFITGQNFKNTTVNLIDSAQRLTQTIEKFIGLFVQPGKPLVIFMDDLQWADKASLDIIQKLIYSQSDNAFCFVGAYRKEKVSLNNALKSTIEDIQKTHKNFKELELKPLSEDDVKNFLSDLLNIKTGFQDLLNVLINRTMGNPYFIIEYITSLYDQKLIQLDSHKNTWTWDIDKIKDQKVTANIADLISQKINNQDKKTIQILKTASCLGTAFDEYTLSKLHHLKLHEIKNILEKAKQESLITSTEHIPNTGLNPDLKTKYYRFIHDKVQSAIYELMSTAEKAQLHKEIGLALNSAYSVDLQNIRLYEIATHLNKAKTTLNKEEKKLLLKINLKAAKRSKETGGFIPAYKFCNLGFQLMKEKGSGEHSHNLVFDYHIELAEIAALNGNHSEMEHLLSDAEKIAQTLLEKIRIHEIRTASLVAQNKQQDAVNETLISLNLAGIKLPKTPTAPQMLWQLIKTRRKIQKASTDRIADLPPMTDQLELAIMRSMAQVISVLFRTNPNLFALVVFKLIDLTLKRGVAPISPVSFITFGLLTNVIFNDIDKAYELGQLGMKLFEKIDGKAHYAQAYYIYNVGISPWKEPLKNTNKHLLDTYRIAEQTGDYEYMMSAAAAGAHYFFRAGHELNALIKQTQEQKDSISDSYKELSASQFDVLLQLFTNFTIPLQEPEYLKGEKYNEDEMIPYHEKDKDDTSLFMIYLDKLTLAYYFNRYNQALPILEKANKYKKGVAGLLMSANLKFLESLTLLANYHQSDKKRRKKARQTIQKNLRQFQKWANHAPVNFKGQLKLIEAEKEGTYGKESLANACYEEAINLCQQNGFLHEEALANELFGKRWIKKRNKRIATIYLNNAYNLYNQWGAAAKASTLQKNFPDIIQNTCSITEAVSEKSSSTQFTLSVDINTIIDAAKTISSEIVPEELIKKTLTLILEHAGAQKGVLILNDKDTGNWKIEAIGYVDNNNIKIALSNYDLSDKILPVSIINSVISNNKKIRLHNAEKDTNYGSNPYINTNQIKSLLAIPILKQANIVGILYLENNLTTKLFTEDRINVLSILCTQLAISLENARLYDTLEQKVKQRTKEVIRQKEEIQQQATMLESVNNELKTLNSTKDKLFSIIGHDLRNPFNIILGQSDLLLENLDEMDMADTKKSLQFIENASKNAFQLLQNLLDWSRAQTGQLNYYPRKINLKKAIAWDIGLQENMAQAKNIELVNKIPGTIEIYADGDMISTITRNLISNALKFTHNGGQIILEASQKDKFAEISVKDNGVGIKKEHLSKLFVSEDNHTTRGTESEKGVGLGLKLCKDFINQNNGEISVESEYGKGTVFTFTLPLFE